MYGTASVLFVRRVSTLIHLKMNSVEKSSLFRDFVKNAKIVYSGDYMAYYIAQRNKETNRFELWTKDGQPHQWHIKEDAISSFELALRAEGHNNVKLLESIQLDVEISVKIPEAKNV